MQGGQLWYSCGNHVPVFILFGFLPASTVAHPELNSKPSKSARKREHLALQSLGERLIALTPGQLDRIGLDERLLDAVLAAKSIRAHGALRRQKQLIGKLMRHVDPEPIRSAMEAFSSSDRRDKQVFREAENWRDRIAANEPGALEAFFEYLGHDSGAVAREVETLRAAPDEQARMRARRRIFREIHKEIELSVQNAARRI